MNNCYRGEIYYADLGKEHGNKNDHIQRKLRPVAIIQNNTGNRYSPTVIVATLTTKSKNNLPTHVPVTSKGLKGLSFVLLEQIQTINKSDLKEKIGELTPYEVRKVNEALEISVGLRRAI